MSWSSPNIDGGCPRLCGLSKFGLYTVALQSQVGRLNTNFYHGKFEEETTSQDVEAQTPEAPQSEPPQETYLAEITAIQFLERFKRHEPAHHTAGFLL